MKLLLCTQTHQSTRIGVTTLSITHVSQRSKCSQSERLWYSQVSFPTAITDEGHMMLLTTIEITILIVKSVAPEFLT